MCLLSCLSPLALYFDLLVLSAFQCADYVVCFGNPAWWLINLNNAMIVQVLKQCTLNLNLAFFNEQPLIWPEVTWPLFSVYRSNWDFLSSVCTRRDLFCLAIHMCLSSIRKQICTAMWYLQIYYRVLQPFYNITAFENAKNMFASAKQHFLHVGRAHAERVEAHNIPFHDWLVWEQEIIPL